MLSGRLSTLFQAQQKSVLSVDEPAITELQAKIACQYKAILLKKVFLLGMKSEITEARMTERLTANTFFSGSAASQALQKNYLALQEDIEKCEQAKALLELDLKKLRNEAPDDELEERAGKYSPSMRMNFTAIDQTA